MRAYEYLKTFRAALGFLSLAPVGRPEPLTPEQLGRFPAFYPQVGLVLGAGLFLLGLLAARWLPPDVTALLVVVGLTAATRGFHLDGLADTGDALFSHRPREQKLAILKDSRQGTFGVLAIVLDVVIKIQLLTHLIPIAPWVLLLWPVWGRLGASAVAVLSPYVGSETGLGRFMVEKSSLRELGLAALFTLGLSSFFGLAALGTAGAAFLFGLFLVPVWRRALGGVTGDMLGASVELTEIFALSFFYLGNA
ncbi:adenosylcobinamide-GDP ribazoletransferase [Deltaproteobacteria bacterium]|nr:adenosylcobinamide-GDP ribazoletransferase [Deltaproteobacteria bacterium]GHV56433.1 adenosylcobinamide-GDP ribazoletransferase [Deltaproteobacteria bacterium]